MMWWTTELSPGKVLSVWSLFFFLFLFMPLKSMCHYFRGAVFVSVFFWLASRRQRWSRTNIKVSGSTFSLMMGGQQTSLLSHSPLIALNKCPLRLSSLSLPFPNLFHFHPPLNIHLHLLSMFSSHSLSHLLTSSPPSFDFYYLLPLPAFLFLGRHLQLSLHHETEEGRSEGPLMSSWRGSEAKSQTVLRPSER